MRGGGSVANAKPKYPPDVSGGHTNFEQMLAPLDNRDYSFNVCE